MVFCDSKLTSLDGQYAAAFGLSTSGETLILTDASGKTVDTITFGQIQTDMTYGRIPDGSDNFAYMNPSPDAKNEEKSVVSTDVAEPVLSKASGFYNDAFSLSIEIPEGTTVYYTLDGSDPTTKSSLYTSPISVKDATSNPNVLSARSDIAAPEMNGFTIVEDTATPDENVDKAFIIRAVAVDKNGNYSDIVTGSYFIGYQNRASYYNDMKVISLVTDNSNLFDHEKGIYVLGKVYEDWKKANKNNFFAYMQPWTIPANYTQKGSAWERRANMQIFDKGELKVNQDVGIRIHGGATRSYAQKSFNIYARGDYGASKLKYNLFDGNVRSEFTGKKIKEFDSFVLRNGGNDSTYTRFRDKLNQSLVSDRNILTQGMEPCIVFIDGEYWGQYEITEKLDEDFVSAHYGVGKKNVCIVKNEELDAGDAETFAEWEQLRRWIKSTDFSNDANYQELCEKIDMQSFIDYASTELYINNWDWGDNNMAMWKSSQTDEANPYADGKWRFILFDTEYSAYLYHDDLNTSPYVDAFRLLMNKDCFITDLLKAAMKNDDFKNLFSNTFMDMRNTNFNASTVSSDIYFLADEYYNLSMDTFNRFCSSTEYYETEVSYVDEFYNNRYNYAPTMLKNNLQLETDLVTVTLENDDSKGRIRFNTIYPEFVDNTWTGEYYRDYNITISAEPEPGYEFAYWIFDGDENNVCYDNDIWVTLGENPKITAVYEEVEQLMGDVNLDGEVNIADGVMLQNWLLGNGELTYWQNADLCKDGKIDVFDFCLLRQKLK